MAAPTIILQITLLVSANRGRLYRPKQKLLCRLQRSHILYLPQCSQGDFVAIFPQLSHLQECVATGRGAGGATLI